MTNYYEKYLKYKLKYNQLKSHAQQPSDSLHQKSSKKKQRYSRRIRGRPGEFKPIEPEEIKKDPEYYRENVDEIIKDNIKNIDKLFNRLISMHEFEIFKLLDTTLNSLNILDTEFRYGHIFRKSEDIPSFTITFFIVKKIIFTSNQKL